MSQHIIQNPHKTLREVAKPVSDTEFGTRELTEVIDTMKHALHDTADGVAIAAPQIGVSKRIFVVSGRVYESPSENADQQTHPDTVYINPEIIKHSKKTELLEEGCLSVRNYFGYVPRYTQATVRAQDEDGYEFSEGRGGLIAEIFQHEIDHLDGVLFTDKAHDVEYREPQKNT